MAPSRKLRSRRTSRSTRYRNPSMATPATGIRSIVAALPTITFLAPLVDLRLTSMALTFENKASQKNGITITDATSIYGLSGLVMLKYVNILARSSSAATVVTASARVSVDTPYTDAKLNSLTVSMVPDNPIQSRSGRWGMLLVPFRDLNDEDNIRESYYPITLQQLQQMAGSVSGPADKPLHLSFRPVPEDGLSFEFNPIASYFCAIIIAYSESIRPAYHEFTAEDFSPDVTVKGSIQLRQPHLGSPTVRYKDDVWSPNYPAAVYSEKDNTMFAFRKTARFSCRRSVLRPKQCRVTGHAVARVGNHEDLPSL